MADGRYMRRKHSADLTAVRELREQGLVGTAIASQLVIGRARVYRVLSE